MSSHLFHLGLPKYHKIIKLKSNFVGYILLSCWLILTNKHYLLVLVTNDSWIIIIIIIIIIKINREIFVKYWVNLKQLMWNSEILWRKSKKINTKKTTLVIICSPPAEVPSSRLDDSMVDEMETGEVFSGFLPFFLSSNFISPHSSHSFRFISFAAVMVRQAWSAGTHAIHRFSSHLIPCAEHG